jgi:hypothetical protein
MHDKHFNRVKLFWAADAHKKFMDKKNKDQESLLDMAKYIPIIILQILIGVGVTVALFTALLYTILWFV